MFGTALNRAWKWALPSSSSLPRTVKRNANRGLLQFQTLASSQSNLIPRFLKLWKSASLLKRMNCRRLYSSESQGFHENPFENNVGDYQVVVNRTMSELVEKCEELESLNIAGFDALEKDGVFELHLGTHGTYVINKQAPNRQLWWSSPISGPKRYNYDAARGAWRNTRDGHFMYDQLNKELSQMLNINFNMYTLAKKPTL